MLAEHQRITVLTLCTIGFVRLCRGALAGDDGCHAVWGALLRSVGSSSMSKCATVGGMPGGACSVSRETSCALEMAGCVVVRYTSNDMTTQSVSQKRMFVCSLHTLRSPCFPLRWDPSSLRPPSPPPFTHIYALYSRRDVFVIWCGRRSAGPHPLLLLLLLLETAPLGWCIQRGGTLLRHGFGNLCHFPAVDRLAACNFFCCRPKVSSSSSRG